VAKGERSVGLRPAERKSKAGITRIYPQFLQSSESSFRAGVSSNHYSFRQDQTYYEKRVAATEIEMRGMSAEEDKSE
jgi:hypothetical protein